jgi:hypothetical protein
MVAFKVINALAPAAAALIGTPLQRTHLQLLPQASSVPLQLHHAPAIAALHLLQRCLLLPRLCQLLLGGCQLCCEAGHLLAEAVSLLSPATSITRISGLLLGNCTATIPHTCSSSLTVSACLLPKHAALRTSMITCQC